LDRLTLSGQSEVIEKKKEKTGRFSQADLVPAGQDSQLSAG